jgi:hypothetical protein
MRVTSFGRIFVIGRSRDEYVNPGPSVWRE